MHIALYQSKKEPGWRHGEIVPENFLAEYRAAAGKDDARELPEFWWGAGNRLLRIVHSGDFFRIRGAYGKSDGLGQLSWPNTKCQPGRQRDYEIHCEGRLTGYSGEGVLEIKARGPEATVYVRKRIMMHIADNKKTILMLIDDLPAQQVTALKALEWFQEGLCR